MPSCPRRRKAGVPRVEGAWSPRDKNALTHGIAAGSHLQSAAIPWVRAYGAHGQMGRGAREWQTAAVGLRSPVTERETHTSHISHLGGCIQSEGCTGAGQGRTAAQQR